jgi:hypothetical protein
MTLRSASSSPDGTEDDANAKADERSARRVVASARRPAVRRDRDRAQFHMHGSGILEWQKAGANSRHYNMNRSGCSGITVVQPRPFRRISPATAPCGDRTPGPPHAPLTTKRPHVSHVRRQALPAATDGPADRADPPTADSISARSRASNGAAGSSPRRPRARSMLRHYGCGTTPGCRAIWFCIWPGTSAARRFAGRRGSSTLAVCWGTRTLRRRRDTCTWTRVSWRTRRIWLTDGRRRGQNVPM